MSSHLSALTVSSAREVDAVDEAVEKLASVLDGKGGADEAAARAAAQEVERRTEELMAQLDRLSLVLACWRKKRAKQSAISEG
ncbi:hypothetical protein BAE44_0017868 [Dichanthelium oligosanthes]|uniref:Rx N-terminal domain-containing protein n=1 Tax=Dichanthelium oligosanthes TaxID=888268 RepID=A0A1E5V7J2_9POAL|nr:hypothetical protein BAE44_0017868 [Dichanthelium oligosanthes]